MDWRDLMREFSLICLIGDFFVDSTVVSSVLFCATGESVTSLSSSAFSVPPSPAFSDPSLSSSLLSTSSK